MRCSASRILSVIALLFMLRPGLSMQKPQDQTVSFEWLNASGETQGLKYRNHLLQPFSLHGKGGPPVEIEQEEAKVDAQTTRITRRAYMTSVNGERQLTETVVEEIRKMPGDRIRAVKTISRKDSSGRFQPIQQEIQDMAPSGPDSYQTKNTLLLPGQSGSLVEKEQIQQTERRTGDKTVEIDRIRFMAGGNGGWNASERRVSQNTTGAESVRSEEQVYQYDINNRLSLARQIQTKEWKDSRGRHRQSESFARDLQGKLQLDSRTTILQSPQNEGNQVTVETLERPNPAAPNEGLRLVRKIVENVNTVGSNETEKHLEVMEAGLDGSMRTLYSQKSTEVK